MHLSTWVDFLPVSGRNCVPKPSGRIMWFPSNQSQTCCASWHHSGPYGDAHSVSGSAHVPIRHAPDHATKHHKVPQHPDSQYSPLDLPADESHVRHLQSRLNRLEYIVGEHGLLRGKWHVVSPLRLHRAYAGFHELRVEYIKHLTTVHILRHNPLAKSRQSIPKVPAIPD